MKNKKLSRICTYHDNRLVRDIFHIKSVNERLIKLYKTSKSDVSELLILNNKDLKQSLQNYISHGH